MLKDSLQYVLDNYLDGEVKVSSTSPIYHELVHNAPTYIKHFIKRSDFSIKGSIGQGNKTDYPWISILNRNITTSTKFGLYVVYLFKKDMSGFYLTLDQGITYFEENFGRGKYKAAQEVVKYFREHADNHYFSEEDINLVDTRSGTLGYGYEKTAIFSKYYESNKFSEEELEEDLKKMISIYDEIYKNMDTDSYNEIIDRIITSKKKEKDHLVLADDAIDNIRTALQPVDGQPYDHGKMLKPVTPFVDKSTKYKDITNPIITKTDWVKKAKKDAEIGLLGEELVLEYEKQRLSNLGLDSYIDKIQQVSVKSDGFGYDILSFDLIGLEVKEIYIEVKTTSNKVDVEFPVSKGEVDRSKILNKQYFIYRIYDVLKEPKFYRVNGAIEDHFLLDPITYLAKYKG